MVKDSKIFIIFNFLILLIIIKINGLDLDSSVEHTKLLIEGEFGGSCQAQLNTNPQERNCRYGRCEQTKNGTEYVCHCDNFITGEKCDRLVVDLDDGCASNPCWGESLCITLEDTNNYKCLCPETRTGPFCHIIVKEDYPVETNEEIESEYSQESGIEHLTSLITSLTNLFTVANQISTNTTLGLLTSPINYTKNTQLKITTHKINYTSIFENITNYTTSTVINNRINTSNLRTEPIVQSNNSKLQLSDLISNLTINKEQNLTFNCNNKTCQNGKCLFNGTCECIKPAFGEFCDQIDECLELSCKNGYCQKGKGCICYEGYTGNLCDISQTTTTTTTTPSTTTTTTTFAATTHKISTNTVNNSITSIQKTTALLTKLATTITSTATSSTSQKSTFLSKIKQTTTKKQHDFKFISNQTKTSTSMKKEFLITPSFRFQKNTTFSQAKPTTQYINSCENGGLLIDNICICLNQFTGLRCEIPPTFSDSSSFYPFHTKAPELESIEPITPRTFSYPSSSKTEKIETKNEDEELIPIFTISRFNSKTKNITSQRSFYWPWFECFPSNSRVYSINKKTGLVEEKIMSNLEIDDEILVIDNYQKNSNFSHNQFKFSRVVSFLHKIENIDANFLRIHYSIQANLTQYTTLTPRHLIFVKKANKSNFEFMPSSDVRVGDWLKFYDYNQQIHKIVNVIQIETVNLSKSGIYAPLTESGTIVVDNILTSCYSMVKNHKTAQLFFNILNRLNYFIKITSDSYVIYSKFLYEALNFFQLSNLFLNVNF